MITTAAGGSQGVVCLIVQDQPQGWSVEEQLFQGTNVVRCEVITNVQHNLIISTYLSPYTLNHISDLEDSLTCFRDQDTIVIGDCTANIGKLQNPCSQQVADLMTDFGLTDLLHLFRQG